jgi:hypothetical protein
MKNIGLLSFSSNLKRQIGIASTLFDSRLKQLAYGTLKIYLVGFAIIPLSTRIYGPEAFGVLNTYVSLVCILVIPAMLKIDLAISMCKNSEEASALARIATASLVFYTLGLCGLILVFGHHVKSSFPEIAAALPIIPLGVFGGGVISIVGSLYVSERNIVEANKLQFTQLVTTLFAQVVLGVMGLKTIGLLLSDAIGRNTQLYNLINRLYAAAKYYKPIKHGELTALLIRYRRFPIFIVPGNLGRYAISYSIPIAVFQYYGAESAGVLAVAQRLAGLPRTVFGSAFNLMFTVDWKQGSSVQQLVGIYKSKSRLLLLTLGALCIVIALSLSVGATHLLGAEWGLVGYVVCAITPFYLLDAHLFSVSPLMQLWGRQKLLMVFDVMIATSQLLAVVGSVVFELPFYISVLVLGGLAAFACLIVEIVQYRMLSIAALKAQ